MDTGQNNIALYKQKMTELKNCRGKTSPLVIEIAGLPKAGKSTIIECIYNFFRKNGWDKTIVIFEGIQSSTVSRKNGLLHYNLYFVFKTLLETIEKCETGQNLIIVERGIFDRLGWFLYLHEIGHNGKKILSEDFQTIKDFLMLESLRSLFHLTIFLHCDIQTSLEREAPFILTLDDETTVMNKESLVNLEYCFNAVASEIEEKKLIPLIRHNTTGETVQETSWKLFRRIIDYLLERETNNL